MAEEESDFELVGRVLALTKLTEEQRAAFEDMAEYMADGDWRRLSEKQRAWAKGLLDEPEYKNLVSSGLVPRGRPVPTPPVLQRQNLPLRPPKRPA